MMLVSPQSVMQCLKDSRSAYVCPCNLRLKSFERPCYSCRIEGLTMEKDRTCFMVVNLEGHRALKMVADQNNQEKQSVL